MAVTVSISGEFDSMSLEFGDDDAAYWHLFPYFERAFRVTGEMVDLHGDAEFAGEQLQAFLRVLEDATSDVHACDLEWMVTVGYRTSGRIQKPILKEAVLSTLASLKSMLNKAYNESRSVVCLGD